MLFMLKKTLQALINLCFPKLCFHCQTKISNGYLCKNCYQRINFIKKPACPYCGGPLNPEINICNRCRDKIYPYNKLISTTSYSEPMPSLIGLFKYKNYHYLDEFFGSLMIKYLTSREFNATIYDFIIAVPLHKYKLKSRGYNQSGLLAKQLANYFQIPLRDDIISNVNFTVSQTKLPKNKRKTNTENTFTVEKNLRNKNIILVDDIFTTGSTINACCKALKEKNANKITVLTLSKTI